MLSKIQRNIIIRAIEIRKETGEDPVEILTRYKNLTKDEKARILEEIIKEE